MHKICGLYKEWVGGATKGFYSAEECGFIRFIFLGNSFWLQCEDEEMSVGKNNPDIVTIIQK